MVLLRNYVHAGAAETRVIAGKGLPDHFDRQVTAIPTGFDLGNFGVNERLNLAAEAKNLASDVAHRLFALC
jgi:hypothetical protein